MIIPFTINADVPIDRVNKRYVSELFLQLPPGGRGERRGEGIGGPGCERVGSSFGDMFAECFDSFWTMSGVRAKCWKRSASSARKRSR